MKRKKAKCGFCKSDIDIIIRGNIKEGFCEKCSKSLTNYNIIDEGKVKPNPNLRDSQIGWTLKMKK